MSYDMTLGAAGYGLGGSSGLGGWLGNLGNAWQNGLSNNLRLATDLYNFTNKSLTDPSAVNAMVSANLVKDQNNQSQYTDAWYENQMKNAMMRSFDGKTLNDILQNPGYGVVNSQSNTNQQAQVQAQPVNQAPSQTTTTAYAQQQGLGPYRTGYQLAQPQNTELAGSGLLQQMLQAPSGKISWPTA